MTIELRFIEPDKLHEYWPLLRPGVERVRDKIGDEEWIAEDVYLCLRTKAASCYAGFVDDRYVGHVIAQPHPTAHGMAIHIWQLYHVNDGTDFMELFNEQFDRICRAAGAYKQRMFSPREWGKRLAPHGWEPRHTVYERRL